MRRDHRRWPREGLAARRLTVAAIVGAAGVASTLYASNQASDAAGNASAAQTASAQAGIAQQNQMFQQVQQLLSPYVTQGNNALGAQGNLIGLNGNSAQQSAIDSLQNSAMFQSLKKQGETSILQNASATGGLRGGNTQAALAQYSPQLLNSVIQQQYQNLGGITSIGQNAAAGVGNAGMSTGNNITSLYGNIGSAQAGNALAQGNANIGLVNGLSNSLGTYAGIKGYNGFGGATGGGALSPAQTSMPGYVSGQPLAQYEWGG